MEDLHEEIESQVNSSHLTEQYDHFYLTSAGAGVGVEQGACTSLQGFAPDLALHVVSDKLLGAFQVSEQRLRLVLECEVLVILAMNDLHEEMKYSVISSYLSEIYEGQLCSVIAGSGVKQEACIGVREISPNLATHVLSDKSLGTLQMDDLHGDMKLLVISLHLSEQSGEVIFMSEVACLQCSSYAGT